MPTSIPIMNEAGERKTLTIPDGADQAAELRWAISQGWKPAPPESGMAGVSQALGAARSKVQEAINAQIRQLMTPTPGPTGRRLPGPPTAPGDPFESTVGNIAAGALNPVPGSVPEAAALGAMGAAGPLAAGMRPLAAAATRAGIPAAAVGAASLAEGEDPKTAFIRAIITAATLGGVETAGGAIRLARQFGRELITPQGLVREGQIAAVDAAKALQQEVPSLGRLVRPSEPDSLLRLRDPKVGKRALSEMAEATDQAIITHFGQQDLAPQVRTLARIQETVRDMADASGVPLSRETRMALKQIRDMDNMTADQALARIKLLKNIARDTESGAESFLFREGARIAEEELKTAMPAALRSQYEGFVREFDSGLDWLAVMQKSKAFEGGAGGGAVDRALLGQFLHRNIEKFPPSTVPNLYLIASRGNPGFARDVVLNVTGGERVGVSGAGGFFTVSIPRVVRLQKAGAPPITQPSGGLLDISTMLGAQSVLDQPVNVDPQIGDPARVRSMRELLREAPLSP